MSRNCGRGSKLGSGAAPKVRELGGGGSWYPYCITGRWREVRGAVGTDAAHLTPANCILHLLRGELCK